MTRHISIDNFKTVKHAALLKNDCRWKRMLLDSSNDIPNGHALVPSWMSTHKDRN